MTDWHRWLAASGEYRTTGRAITGASNLAFLFLVLSGAYLWIPRTWAWRAVKQVIWFRGGLPGKARDFNWHNTIGVWCVAPLALIVASGAVISYPWASNLVYRIVGEAPPAPAGRGGAAAPAQTRTAGARGEGATGRGCPVAKAAGEHGARRSAGAIPPGRLDDGPRPPSRVADGHAPPAGRRRRRRSPSPSTTAAPASPSTAAR